LLREQSGEDLDGLGDWWTNYQEANQESRQTMADEVMKTDRRPKKRRRRRNSPKPTADPAQ
jgi:poly(A) polymerase